MKKTIYPIFIQTWLTKTGTKCWSGDCLKETALDWAQRHIRNVWNMEEAKQSIYKAEHEIDGVQYRLLGRIQIGSKDREGNARGFKEIFAVLLDDNAILLEEEFNKISEEYLGYINDKNSSKIVLMPDGSEHLLVKFQNRYVLAEDASFLSLSLDTKASSSEKEREAPERQTIAAFPKKKQKKSSRFLYSLLVILFITCLGLLYLYQSTISLVSLKIETEGEGIIHLSWKYQQQQYEETIPFAKHPVVRFFPEKTFLSLKASEAEKGDFLFKQWQQISKTDMKIEGKEIHLFSLSEAIEVKAIFEKSKPAAGNPSQDKPKEETKNEQNNQNKSNTVKVNIYPPEAVEAIELLMGKEAEKNIQDKITLALNDSRDFTIRLKNGEIGYLLEEKNGLNKQDAKTFSLYNAPEEVTLEFKKNSFALTTEVKEEGNIEYCNMDNKLETPGNIIITNKKDTYEYKTEIHLEAKSNNDQIWKFKEWSIQTKKEKDNNKGGSTSPNNPLKYEIFGTTTITAIFQEADGYKGKCKALEEWINKPLSSIKYLELDVHKKEGEDQVQKFSILRKTTKDGYDKKINLITELKEFYNSLINNEIIKKISEIQNYDKLKDYIFYKDDIKNYLSCLKYLKYFYDFKQKDILKKDISDTDTDKKKKLNEMENLKFKKTLNAQIWNQFSKSFPSITMTVKYKVYESFKEIEKTISFSIDKDTDINQLALVLNKQQAKDKNNFLNLTASAIKDNSDNYYIDFQNYQIIHIYYRIAIQKNIYDILSITLSPDNNKNNEILNNIINNMKKILGLSQP